MRIRNPAVLAALPCLATCNTFPESVLMSGTVFDAPYDDGQGAAGVTVTTRDGSLDVFSDTVTGEDGAFEVEVASQQHLYVELSGEGRTTTLFAGEVGAYDMEVAQGVLYVRPDSWAAYLVAEFGACAETALAAEGAGTGVIEGEVRLYASGVNPPDAAILGNAWAEARRADGTTWEACYLDDAGEADPDAIYTGARGRFAIFGVPADALLLLVSYGDRDAADADDTAAGPWYSWVYEVLMVDGAVAPFYPAWVEQVGS